MTIACVGLTSACGSDEARTESAPDATSADATPDGEPPFTWSDAAARDIYVPEPPDVGLLDGGGLFLCSTCVCDGRTHYCDFSSAGAPAPLAPFPGDAGPCPDGGSMCRPLPPSCIPANCACLPNETTGGACACFRSKEGDGLMAGCVLP